MLFGYCCCDTGCLIAEDDFSTALGARWTQESGSWSIVNEELKIEDSDAYIEFNTTQPDGVAAHFVAVDITFSSYGDKAGILLSEELYCEVVFGPVPHYTSYWSNWLYGGSILRWVACATLNIWYNTSLLITQPYITHYTDQIRLQAGYTKEKNLVGINLYTLGEPYSGLLTGRVSTATNTPSSLYVGLRTGDTVTGPILFDNFKYYRSKTTAHPECPEPYTAISYPRPCLIADAPRVEDLSNLQSEDLACNWTILSGIWDGDLFDANDPYYYQSGTWCKLTTTSQDAFIQCNIEQTGSYLGYVQVTQVVRIPSEATIRIYIDYDSSSDSHYADFKVYDRGVAPWPYEDATTAAVDVTLYKNGSVLREKTLTTDMPVSDDLFVFALCLRTSEIYSTYDNLVAHVTSRIYESGLDNPGQILAGDEYYYWGQVLTATNVIGNTKWAFGVVESDCQVEFLGAPLYKSSGTCYGCGWPADCEPCPAGEGPANGLSIAIEGFTTPYGGICDCPTSLDGTYNVPNGSHVDEYCHGSQMYGPLCQAYIFKPPYGPTWLANVYLRVMWQITVDEVDGWILTVFLQIHATAPDESYTQGSRIVEYRKSFSSSDLCRDILSDALTYYGQSGTLDLACENLDGLTVTATGY